MGGAGIFYSGGMEEEEEEETLEPREKEERERGALSSSFPFGIVILGSDFVPILGGREGVRFLSPLFFSPLNSSPHLTAPPPKADRRLGSVNSNPYRLAMLPTRSTPSGLPPFSYCLINRLFASLAPPACWLQH